MKNFSDMRDVKGVRQQPTDWKKVFPEDIY